MATIVDETRLQRLLSDMDSLASVASAVGVHRSTVSRWRTGERFPSRANAQRLIRYFGPQRLRIEDCLYGRDAQ